MKIGPRRETVALWQAAAWGAHRSGDHEAELRYRNIARMMRRRPPIVRPERCVDGTRLGPRPGEMEIGRREAGDTDVWFRGDR